MIKRRILFFHSEFPAGGAERVTMDIADFVAQYGYETYVITHQINSGSFKVEAMLTVRRMLTLSFILSTR